MNRPRARDERGVVAILVAASLVVLCMGCAMAVDLGNVAQLHRHAQLTVDDAAISGADLLEQGTDTLTQIVSATEGYIDENWANLSSSAWNTCPSVPSGYSAPSGSNENCVTFNGSSTAAASAISVELPPQSVPFTVARLGGFTSGTVEASASARIVPGISPCALCLLGPAGLTLNDTASGSFTVTDSAGSGNAGIVVDSTGTPAAKISGSGSITAPQIDVTGSDTDSGSGSFKPPPTTGAPPVPDPLGSIVPPTPANATIPTQAYTNNTSSSGGTLSSGTYGSVSLGGSGSVTIPPGNYSSISVSGSGSLTLESGTYFITGPFSVSASGSVYESGGVLLYFTCSSGGQVAACASGGQSGGSLSLTGSGSVTLSPVTSGNYSNLTVFYDRNDTASVTIAASGSLSVSGTIYAKSSALALSGSGSNLSSLVVVNSAAISGSGSVGVTYNASANVSPPGMPYLCSTTANNC